MTDTPNTKTSLPYKANSDSIDLEMSCLNDTENHRLLEVALRDAMLTHGETKAQRREGTYRRSHSKSGLKPGLDLRSLEPFSTHSYSPLVGGLRHIL